METARVSSGLNPLDLTMGSEVPGNRSARTLDGDCSLGRRFSTDRLGCDPLLNNRTEPRLGPAGPAQLFSSADDAEQFFRQANRVTLDPRHQYQQPNHWNWNQNQHQPMAPSSGWNVYPSISYHHGPNNYPYCPQISFPTTFQRFGFEYPPTQQIQPFQRFPSPNYWNYSPFQSSFNFYPSAFPYPSPYVVSSTSNFPPNTGPFPHTFRNHATLHSESDERRSVPEIIDIIDDSMDTSDETEASNQVEDQVKHPDDSASSVEGDKSESRKSVESDAGTVLEQLKSISTDDEALTIDIENVDRIIVDESSASTEKSTTRETTDTPDDSGSFSPVPCCSKYLPAPSEIAVGFPENPTLPKFATANPGLVLKLVKVKGKKSTKSNLKQLTSTSTKEAEVPQDSNPHNLRKLTVRLMRLTVDTSKGEDVSSAGSEIPDQRKLRSGRLVDTSTSKSDAVWKIKKS